MQARCLLPVLLATSLAAHAADEQTLPALQALAGDQARVSALVVDLGSERTLAALEPKSRLTPASVSKLYAAAGALAHWGPDHRFVNRVVTGGEVRDGTLAGDLMLIGAGDPGLDHSRLSLLASRLRQRGIERVSGDLVINDSLFGPVPCLTEDRCAARQVSENSYDAPLSAAGVNFSNVEVTIIPGREPDQPARLTLMPPALEGFALRGDIATGEPDTRAAYWAWRATDGDLQTLHLAGVVPAGGGHFSLLRSVSEPSRYAGQVLKAVLAGQGIDVAGTVRVDHAPPDPHLVTLAEETSPTLANQLRDMMAYSNNYMADVLTLGLATEADGPGPAKSGLAAASTMLAELGRRANAEAQPWLGTFPEDPPLTLTTGSGLSVDNRLSAADVVSLLAYMYRQPALFPALIGSLPVPQYTPSRSVKNGNNDFAMRVAAKTGSLTEPVSVRAYAGYLRLEDGGWGAFAIIINGTEASPDIRFKDSMGAIRSDLERILAEY
ncbi:MAG: D-alanyl-D-alanine carboxypeptidase/D-alanyl-D-alanine-endopeptidase [Salinisphaeraceae bacterium]